MFKPIADKSKREVVYEAIKNRPSDEDIPYDAMPYDREVLIGLRESVAKLFLREQRRYVVCIRGVGWRVVQGKAQVDQAARHRRRATRRMGNAVQIIEATDRSEMSAEERVRADAELIVARTGYGVLRGLANKRIGLDDIKAWQDSQGEKSVAA